MLSDCARRFRGAVSRAISIGGNSIELVTLCLPSQCLYSAVIYNVIRFQLFTHLAIASADIFVGN